MGMTYKSIRATAGMQIAEAPPYLWIMMEQQMIYLLQMGMSLPVAISSHPQCWHSLGKVPISINFCLKSSNIGSCWIYGHPHQGWRRKGHGPWQPWPLTPPPSGRHCNSCWNRMGNRSLLWAVRPNQPLGSFGRDVFFQRQTMDKHGLKQCHKPAMTGNGKHTTN